MPQVRIAGWNPGLKTVHVIKLIREQARLPLNEALDLVNRGLNHNETIVLDLPDEMSATQFVNRVKDFGAIATVLP
jgi:ribosomal protein L7/L12